MSVDYIYSIQFYLIYSLCGVIGFYLLSKVLPKTSKVLLYAVSKPLGLIVLTYPIWLFSSAQILPFNNRNLLLVIFLFIIALFTGGIIYDLHLKYGNKKIDIQALKNFLIKFAIVELSMIALFAIYLLIRSFNPQVDGTEKFMDLMMLSSSGKTQYFPFADAWWSGKDVNYYYYGFAIFALIANIGSIPYSYAYNLALGILFAQTFITCAAIIYRVTRNYASAFFGSALVNLAGNLHYTSCLAQNFNEKINSACYYPKASRILDPAYTINEFPTYSYILGDLHPHMISLPFFTLTLYLLVEIFREKKFNIFLHLLFGFSLAAAGLVNFWDFMTLGGIYAIIFIYKLGKRIWNNRKEFKKFFTKEKFDIGLRFITAILLAASPFILYLPFFLHFTGPVAGIGFTPEFVAYHSEQYPDMQWPSSPWFQFGMWGIFLVLIIPAFITTAILDKVNRKKIALPLILFGFGVFLIIFTELFFFRDLFHIANPPYFRANTVFKFTYHSWILFGIATGISLSLLWKALAIIKNIKWGIFVDILTLALISIVFSIAFVYPYFGFNQAYSIQTRIDNLNDPEIPEQYKPHFTLDGSYFLKDRNINDYNTIQWINQNVHERTVIMESVGSAYTYNTRITDFTGMRTVMGWESHEWTWRFSYPKGVTDWKEVTSKHLGTGYNEIAVVSADVKRAYETTDIDEARKVFEEYDVKYVYVGDQERTTYPNLQEDKFSQLGEIVYQSGDSRLYKIEL